MDATQTRKCTILTQRCEGKKEMGGKVSDSGGRAQGSHIKQTYVQSLSVLNLPIDEFPAFGHLTEPF